MFRCPFVCTSSRLSSHYVSCVQFARAHDIDTHVLVNPAFFLLRDELNFTTGPAIVLNVLKTTANEVRICNAKTACDNQ